MLGIFIVHGIGRDGAGCLPEGKQGDGTGRWADTQTVKPFSPPPFHQVLLTPLYDQRVLPALWHRPQSGSRAGTMRGNLAEEV
jgi:hypothetical protein